MKSNFLILIGLIFFVNASHVQSSLVSHVNVSEGNTYGPTKREETLWSIAPRLHSDQAVSRYQVMLGLFKANPQAFQNSCNMNSLKTGVLLQVPSLSILHAIDHTEAIQEVGKQEAQWQHRKVQPVSCSALHVPALERSSKQKVKWLPIQPPVTHPGEENRIFYSDWVSTNSTNIPLLSFPKVQPLTVTSTDLPVQQTTKVQETLPEDFLTVLSGPSSSPEMFIELSQTHGLPQTKMPITHQEGVENMILDSPVQKTTEAQKTVSKDFLLGDTHIVSFILLLVGGILMGGWVIRKLSIPHPDDDQLHKDSKNKGEANTDQKNDVVLVTMRKKQLQQLKKIQTYSENYRFYPLTEAFLVGSITFIAIFLTSYFIFYHALEAQKDEIREGLVRTAQAMTTTIDTSLHQTFTRKEQEETQVYQKAIKPFAQVLALNKQIKFIYTVILKDDKIYFILDPTPKGDADGDGVEDSVDIMQEYDDPSGLLGEALRTQRIVVTQEPYTDQWGSLFGAYVPFYDHHGQFIGVLGMDITADKYFKRLMPIKRATIRAIVAGFFIAFLVGSLVWFTRNFSRVINRNRLLLIKELKEKNEQLF